MKKLLLFILLCINQNLLAQFSPEPDPHRGMYVDKFYKTSLSSSSIIDTAFTIIGVDVNFDGIFEKEDSILRYAAENHITYLNLYDLHRIIGRNKLMWDENLNQNVDLEEHLERFMRKAKSKYGITQIGAIGGSANFFDSLANYMQRFPKADFDVVNVEHEFWTDCANEYFPYIDIQEAMFNMKENYNASHPGNPIITEAYLAALYTCNSLYTTQKVVEVIDGCTSCSPCTSCSNPHPRKSDRSLYAWYITDPGSMSIAEQNVFELPSTEDSTDFHPILYSESFNTGGTADFTGVWFPLAPENNIFTAEERYYTTWRNNSAVAFSSPRQNDVQPGGVHWFTSTNMVGHLDAPQILQNTGPYCSIGPDVSVTFNYHGPIENGIVYEFWITKDSDSSIVYPAAGGKVNGISGQYIAQTSGSNIKKNINFSDTSAFTPCKLPPGDYTAHLVLHYDSAKGSSYTCTNKVTIDSRPRININGQASFCQGRYTYLKVNNSGGSVTWYRNGLSIPGTTANLKVTEDGYYSASVSGGTGCTGLSDTVHVHVLANPAIAVNAVCNLDGTATLKTNLNDPNIGSTNTSGPGGVIYRWNTGETTDQITVTPPTSNTGYRVNVTDPYTGCARTGQITLRSPLTTPYPSSITINTPPGSSCSANGTLTANLFSSGGPNNYLWSTGETTRTITNVPPGTYSVAMNVWAFGCTSYSTIVVGTEPTDPPTITANIHNVTCSGGNNGSIELLLSGGNPPFTFYWENFPDDSIHQRNSQDQFSLFEGTYSLRVTDANSCNYFFSFQVEADNESPGIQNISTTPVSTCANNSNGTATVTPIGGTPPYTYLWNDDLQQTGMSAASLKAGSVKVVVSDSQGCSTQGYALVASNVRPVTIEILDSSSTNISCPGNADAQLYLEIKGGLMPYVISSPWIADSNFAMLGGLLAGYHLIEITDAAACTFLDSIYVSEPAPLQIYSSTHSTTCIGCPNGFFDVSFSGGQAPYQITWSGGQGTQAGTKIYDLPGGIYTLCVNDRNNCSVCKQDTIFESSIGISEMSIDNFIIVYPNPGYGNSTVQFSNQLLQNGKIILYAIDGKLMKAYNFSGSTSEIHIRDQIPGVYFLRLQTEAGEIISGTKKLVF
ncbi:MAG TPA: T9SS type A sorting domain-containing protein, partial [Bacteroidia bacterium]|nr:T9SS type A sorting domain-containing protein [Bacteroidia bacterium]